MKETEDLLPQRTAERSETSVSEPDLGIWNQQPCPLQLKGAHAQKQQQGRYLQFLGSAHQALLFIITCTSEHTIFLWDTDLDTRGKPPADCLFLIDQIGPQVTPVFTTFSMNSPVFQRSHLFVLSLNLELTFCPILRLRILCYKGLTSLQIIDFCQGTSPEIARKLLFISSTRVRDVFLWGKIIGTKAISFMMPLVSQLGVLCF